MKYYTLFALIACGMLASAQIQPGFDAEEYAELMLVSVRTSDDSTYSARFPESEKYALRYRSEPIGLDNLWDLSTDEAEKRAVISVRGTTANLDSWLVNIYAAMIPADGRISWMQDSVQHHFRYTFSEAPNAAVHAGWAMATGMLIGDILEQVTPLLEDGYRDIYVIGHSQGGAIAYLVNAQLDYLRSQGILPADLRIKTYCSAAPKPGNLDFAYDYEFRMREGWAFNVINSEDWVPQVPISIQTLHDFAQVNPFEHIDEALNNQPLFRRMMLRHIVRKLSDPTEKAQENYEKYLGEKVSELIYSKIEGLEMPEFVPSSHYVRTGPTVVLQPSKEYFSTFPSDTGNVFIHHTHRPYFHALESAYNQPNPETSPHRLDVTSWVVDSLRSNGEILVPRGEQKATVKFDEGGRVHGFTGCNSFFGNYNYANTLQISALTQTERFCVDALESEFIQALLNSPVPKMVGNQLHLIDNGVTYLWLSPLESEE